ncbi:hypothetical protein [Rhodospirillum rubrum]|uniref:hypothetical protein n=2 Tax=Rhodospirillum rubrum TaxID=1085 RepID=UPI001F5B8DA2|nr:hypothetical protein [Rhodospirillum rubrum]
MTSMIRNTLFAAAAALTLTAPLALAFDSPSDRADAWQSAPVFDSHGALVGTVAHLEVNAGSFPVSVRIDIPSGRDVTLAARDFSLGTFKVTTTVDRSVINQLANGDRIGVNAAQQAN